MQAVAAQGFDHPMNLRELVASRFGPDVVDRCYGNLSKQHGSDEGFHILYMFKNAEIDEDFKPANMGF